MNRNMSTVFPISAGVGFLAGTTAALLYHYFLGRRYIVMLEQDINHLHLSLANLKNEFAEIQDLKSENGPHKRSKKNHKRYVSDGSTTSITDASMYSIESDLDEFRDFSNFEDDTTTTSRSLSSYVTAMSNPSEPVTGEFSHIDTLLEGSDEDKLAARDLLLELQEQRPQDCEVLWRLSRASHALGAMEGAKGDPKKKLELVKKGVEYGEKALLQDSKNPDAHKWFGICVGTRGQMSSTKEKLKDGITYKEHIELAIKLGSSDPSLHNLLARFEFDVSQLSSIERRVAGWLFGDVPSGTVENAIAGFLKTEELCSYEWKENKLLLAKCYIAEGKYKEAMEWLDKAAAVPARNSQDKEFDDELKKLIKKYQAYRK